MLIGPVYSEKMSAVKSIPYLFSQYVWLIILAFFACIPFFIPRKTATGQINSYKNNIPFNRYQIPVVFAHLSDVHVDHAYEYPNNIFNQSISLIIDRIKTDFNIITGDLANNFGGKKIPKYGRQYPEDIHIYETLSKRLRDYSPVIEIDGNHDLFGIYNYDRKQNQSTIYKDHNFTEYRISTHTFDINGRDYTFIALNPFNFPAPHPPFLYFSHPSKDFFDLLEKTIEQVPEENEIIIMDHFPYHQWKFGPKSSTGKTFQDILNNKRIGYFFNGHLHPPNPLYVHHNGVLEIVGSDLLEHQKFSVAIIDNGRLSYHPISVTETKEDTPLAFITNPLPNALLSDHQVFNEKDTFIRMIVYSKEEPDLKASVYPNVFENNQLNCSQINDQNDGFRFWLCETELSIQNYGKYTLNISGLVSKSIEFTIDENIQSYKENVFKPLLSYVVQYHVQLGLIWIFLLIILTPFIHVPVFWKNKFEMWIEGQSFESMWTYSILFGFLAVKNRIERLPNLIRYSLFVAAIWPFCLPILFTTIEGHFGFVWTWGFVCNGAHFGFWGQMFALVYLVGFLLPIVLLFSALAISLPLRWTLFIDLIPTIVCLYYDIRYIFIEWCNESSGALGAAFSLYSLTLLYFYTLMIIWRCFWKKGLKEVSLIPSTALLDNESREQ